MEAVTGSNPTHQAVLEQMIAQYEVLLLRTCYMYLRDRGMAEDATQETFLKAYKALPAFRGECSEKTWLMRIVINTCRDMKRSAWLRHVDRSVDVERMHEPAGTMELGEADDLTQAIMHLPFKYKEVILLYFYQNMTLREIAGVLDIAVSTADKRVRQACKRLKWILQKEEEQ